jgi:hypothetical protein
MPAFIIVQQSGRTGEAVDAVLCDPSAATGYPDRRSDVPIKATMISDKAIRIDDEPHPRAIISAVGENGTATILVGGSTRGLRNRERRVALAKVSGLLQQLAAELKPLAAESEGRGLVTEALGLLWNWLSDERERLTEGARHGPQ